MNTVLRHQHNLSHWNLRIRKKKEIIWKNPLKSSAGRLTVEVLPSSLARSFLYLSWYLSSAEMRLVNKIVFSSIFVLFFFCNIWTMVLAGALNVSNKGYYQILPQSLFLYRSSKLSHTTQSLPTTNLLREDEVA